MFLQKCCMMKKKIEEIEYKIYNKWFSELSEFIDNIRIYYVCTDIDNCYQRIKQRNRDGENEISKEYLELCGKYHNDWLDNYSNKIIFDGNININTSLFNENKYFNKILNDILLLVTN